MENSVNKPKVSVTTLEQFNNLGFRPPYNAQSFYVCDSRGNTVAECRDSKVAKVMAELFNQLSEKYAIQYS